MCVYYKHRFRCAIRREQRDSSRFVIKCEAKLRLDARDGIIKDRNDRLSRRDPFDDPAELEADINDATSAFQTFLNNNPLAWSQHARDANRSVHNPKIQVRNVYWVCSSCSGGGGAGAGEHVAPNLMVRQSLPHAVF